jgi:hypothetical protein
VRKKLDKIFTNYGAAVSQVYKAIDTYNRIRPHMSCSNLTPSQAHAETNPLIRKWKNKKHCKAKSVLL